MTQAEFVATRRPYVCSNGETIVGFTYDGRWHIFHVTDDWPVESRIKGRYCLFIDENEFYSNDLELLEARLYRWIVRLKENSYGI